MKTFKVRVLNIIINLAQDSLYSKEHAINDLLKVVMELQPNVPYVDFSEKFQHMIVKSTS